MYKTPSVCPAHVRKRWRERKIAKCYETDNRFGRCTLLLLSYSPSITVKVQNGEVYGDSDIFSKNSVDALALILGTAIDHFHVDP